MSGKPVSIQNRPNAVFEPQMNSRMKPHTVGGSTMGMVKMASKMLFARERLRFRQKYAANKPRMTMNTMAMPVVQAHPQRAPIQVLQELARRGQARGLGDDVHLVGGAITPKSANEGLA